MVCTIHHITGHGDHVMRYIPYFERYYAYYWLSNWLAVSWRVGGHLIMDIARIPVYLMTFQSISVDFRMSGLTLCSRSRVKNRIVPCDKTHKKVLYTDVRFLRSPVFLFVGDFECDTVGINNV